MRCVIGANGHFHRAPSTASSAARRPSNVTGKIGQRPSTNRLRSKAKSRQNENTRSDRTNRLIKSHIDQFKNYRLEEIMVLDTKVLGRKEMEKVFLLVIVLERKGHFQVLLAHLLRTGTATYSTTMKR